MFHQLWYIEPTGPESTLHQRSWDNDVLENQQQKGASNEYGVFNAMLLFKRLIPKSTADGVSSPVSMHRHLLMQ